MKINAWAATEPKSDLVQIELDSGPLAPFDCVVQIINCAICFSDIHFIDNAWGKSKYPLVPGHEVVGKIVEVGESVTDRKVGEIVGVGYQRTACLDCPDCNSGRENLCKKGFVVTCASDHGGFADYMVTDSRFTIPVNSDYGLKYIGPLLCGGATIYSGLKHAGMKSGQTIGIIGLGGLGHLGVQFAAKSGNKVIVFEYDNSKAEFAAQLGADEVVITKDGVPRNLPYLFDAIVSTIHQPVNWNHYLRLLNSDGTLCFIGDPGNIEINIGYLLVRRRRMMGMQIASRQEIQDTLKAAETLQVKPIIQEYAFSDINQAFSDVRHNLVKYRAVLNH